ncbi:YCF48-related protein [Mucilaginibacter sp. L3T2-6]|uniref:WD40/YVTN/BNR-like repeat-containing protein n=1 Tax=Mucilaginibacter sp. L3T2-6 TaxID=3062491 RepID=UPI0026758440|nr:YCF48-related protein [Mucilaginibacter sp. L3T2-6]MDO3641767.1 YCF48-related protein [Mucilaginibacter sp. L3T2-6]MDV6214261.1 YCF48-related protein [Mucilaginibacter sp. L3T2-6]
MKRIFNSFIFLFVSLAVFGQNEYLAKLSIWGAVSHLGISPSEEIWVATKAGNVYHTKQVGALWHIGPFGSPDLYSSRIGNTFERINFFSEDTMMLSGFIQDNGNEDFVYRSADHGKTWQKVVFGESSWLDAAYVNNNGKAWASGSSQLIYYTSDAGKTWTTFNKVEATGNLRFICVWFAKDEKTGLFGSTWDKIYRTVDNCKSWERLPSPLSQKKYQRLSKGERPEIEKVRIFGDYYIITQENKVFITKSEHIDWKYLPHVVDFEVTEDGGLYTVDDDQKIELFNNEYFKTWESKQKLESSPRAIGVRNNKLFVLTWDHIYKIDKNEFVSSSLLTDDFEITEPGIKVQFNGNVFGFDKNDILRFDETKKKWYRFMTLDFAIENATVFQNKLLVSGGGLNNYYNIDPNSKLITEFKLPNKLFADKSVSSIRFEDGYQGCFSADNLHRVYVEKSGKFIVDNDSSSAKYLSGAVRELDESSVQNIIRVVENARFSKVSIADLDISQEDIKQFKKFIDKTSLKLKNSDFIPFDEDNLYTFPGEYSDFNFYKSAADSLFNVSQENVNNAFWQVDGTWSTTRHWRRIIFKFQDGKILIVENSDDKPNYLYTPWHIDYDGLKFVTNSIKLGQYIDEITKKQFFIKDAREKNYAIFKITDYLYRKKLQER